MTVSSG